MGELTDCLDQIGEEDAVAEVGLQVRHAPLVPSPVQVMVGPVRVDLRKRVSEVRLGKVNICRSSRSRGRGGKTRVHCTRYPAHYSIATISPTHPFPNIKASRKMNSPR